ncbi:MAG: hypothetical protein IPH62_07885 [Ignavibacteriae bacterium]|nr:hypothetical protein [Ignavibacteriota bacterium]
MKTKSLLTIITIFLFTTFLSAQEKDLKGKLKEIKDAKKIVVTTEKGDVVFEGDEANQLLKRMKSSEMKKRIQVISEDDEILTEEIEGLENDDEDILIWKSEDGEEKVIKHKGKGHKIMMFKNDNGGTDIIENKKTIKIKVDDENGEKNVTVTTKENGEEKVETYKGKEADEYLEKMEDEKNMKIDINEDSDSMTIWVEKGDKIKNRIEKNVNVEIENGVKKVTVKSTENGEEKVETFVGEEADKYLEKMEKENSDKKVFKKKIIQK